MSYWLELMVQKEMEEDLVTIEVPKNSLILTPNMSEEDCEKMLQLWLKER